ncbi:hypothetical protein ACFWBB_16835 [Streptomyces sp. NPDC060000]|uniref:hypothetical protein n=1 Tax=Streptomyces sp. NPDC060000 TaxID=3347031 RepID=UPI0036BD4670
MPTSATDAMLPDDSLFCRWIAWSAAAQARATFRVSLTFCEDCYPRSSPSCPDAERPGVNGPW